MGCRRKTAFPAPPTSMDTQPWHPGVFDRNVPLAATHEGGEDGLRRAGDYVGEIALLDQRPRTATVVATTPVSVEVLSQREFVTLLAEAPELSEQIMATMAKRLADIETETR
jgi:CRP-like cAMP-binding protein